MAYNIELVSGGPDGILGLSTGLRDFVKRAGFALDLRGPYRKDGRWKFCVFRVRRGGKNLDASGWDEFNRLVNEYLDGHKEAPCNVWSTPFDVKGYLVIRRNGVAVNPPMAVTEARA